MSSCPTIQVPSNKTDIERGIRALGELLMNLPLPEEKVISLDTEWDVVENDAGYVLGPGALATIQIGYRLQQNGPIHDMILHVTDFRKTRSSVSPLYMTSTVGHIRLDNHWSHCCWGCQKNCLRLEVDTTASDGLDQLTRGRPGTCVQKTGCSLLSLCQFAGLGTCVFERNSGEASSRSFFNLVDD